MLKRRTSWLLRFPRPSVLRGPDKHEKRTNAHEGHERLLGLIDRLETTHGEEQWAEIQEYFNVDRVASYFAVNMVLSHWDGVRRPVPLTFGMAGDHPPGVPAGPPGALREDMAWIGMTARGRPPWWRPGGYFSSPLLANPQFRERFLVRTHEIVETIYTPENYLPVIDAMAERLREDVQLRARMGGEDSEVGLRALARNVEYLKTHLFERRQFLLPQEELRTRR